MPPTVKLWPLMRVSKRTTTAYDAVGNVTTSTDALNHTTSYLYDALDRNTVVIDALTRRTTTGYDAVGNVTQVTNSRNHATNYSYDALHRQTVVADALGNRTTTAYDAVSNLTQIQDVRSNYSTFAYDALDRQTTAIDQLGHRITTAYDAAGNVTTITDAIGKVATFAFDAANHQTKIVDQLGNITTTAYDVIGNATVTIDPLNHRTTTAYDVLNRPTTITDALSGVATMSLDAAGNLTVLIDPVGNRTTWSFDALNRETQKTDPLNQATTYAYDAIGKLTSTTDRLGRRRDMSYDDVNRLLGETWVTAGSPVNTIAYSYDEVGNMLTASDGDGTITMTYDELDRAKTQKDFRNLLLTFSYDQVGNRTKVQDSLNGVTTSTYDAANRLSRREFSDGATPLRLDYTHTDRDQLLSTTRYSDLAGSSKVGSTTYAYDDVGRTTGVKHRDAVDAVFEDYQYTFDAAGRMVTERINANATTTFTHDDTNQLTAATGGRTESYDYDLNGNRDAGGFTVTAGNRIGTDGVYTYTYDIEGNISKRSKGSAQDTWFYGYDHLNHLVYAEKRATDNPSGTLLHKEEYDFDAFGNRVAKRVDSDGNGSWDTTERFSYLNQMAWADLDGSNNLTMRRLYGDNIDQIFARISSGGTVAWYLTDHLGSTTQIINNAGTILNTTTYDSLGTPTDSNSANADRYKFTAREWNVIVESGYFRARNTIVGRFMQEDPKGFAAGDRNLYRYVHNNPLVFTDPLGMQEMSNTQLQYGLADLPIASRRDFYRKMFSRWQPTSEKTGEKDWIPN